ncbi:hypothetical protein PAAG_03074 [Paracoccidioides lutzii Pb01]|uniref:Uncharacterized protein n=1 Tax=Paracoccidioides lutzii (strain ATCC MYA-826 / Pb01) TaxID=502779 RepID=C1GYC0_PARBA|nr:hypothetical protein PAAG_03074 [Paracoccidioides lutzii Pb01]EEH41511.2 hypothetical protein PAAG_03074 [Paracoccidioides lutzii Pb01]
MAPMYMWYMMVRDPRIMALAPNDTPPNSTRNHHLRWTRMPLWIPWPGNKSPSSVITVKSTAPRHQVESAAILFAVDSVGFSTAEKTCRNGNVISTANDKKDFIEENMQFSGKSYIFMAQRRQRVNIQEADKPLARIQAE